MQAIGHERDRDAERSRNSSLAHVYHVYHALQSAGFDRERHRDDNALRKVFLTSGRGLPVRRRTAEVRRSWSLLGLTPDWDAGSEPSE